MAARLKAKPKNSSNGAAKEKENGSRLWIMIAIALVIVIAAAVLVYYFRFGTGSSQASFSSFRNTFNSAPRVAIYVVSSNSTGLGATVGCATQLIEKLLETPQTHRNSSTIGFYVMNSTSCTYSSSGLGSAIKNYTSTSASNCISFSKSEPSIFLNYSPENRTIITRSALYLEGNSAFMSECGIAYEMT